jgi:VanZ family protein
MVRRLCNLARLALVCGTLLILYLALTPSPPSSGIGWDKANHALAMFVVTITATMAYRPARRAVLFGVAYGVTLSVGIEILQWLGDAGRAAEWADLLADGVGILLAAMVLKAFARFGLSAETA